MISNKSNTSFEALELHQWCEMSGYVLNRKVVMYSQERIVNDREFCSLVTIQRGVFCPTVHAWNLRLVFQGFSNCVLPIFPGLSLYRQTNNTSWTNRHREQGIFSKRRKAQMGIRCCDCFWRARKTRKGQWNRETKEIPWHYFMSSVGVYQKDKEKQRVWLKNSKD